MQSLRTMIQTKAIHKIKMGRFKTQVHLSYPLALKQQQIAPQTTTNTTTLSTA